MSHDLYLDFVHGVSNTVAAAMLKMVYLNFVRSKIHVFVRSFLKYIYNLMHCLYNFLPVNIILFSYLKQSMSGMLHQEIVDYVVFLNIFSVHWNYI